MYRPWAGRVVGVELEMNQSCRDGRSLPEGMIRAAIREALRSVDIDPDVRLNSRAADYWHSSGLTWDIKTDASCGWEVASPALEIEDNGGCRELKAVLDKLNEIQPIVSGNCGTHVHFLLNDFTWRDVQRAARVWARFEPFFYELVPLNRRTNRYCRPVYRREWNANPSAAYFAEACRVESDSLFRSQAQLISRESSFNMNNWWRHQRVEIRLHSGTINYTKITNWVMLMWAMFMRGKRTDLPAVEVPSQSTMIRDSLPTEYICRAIGLVPSKQIPDVPEEATRLVRWLDARRTQFQRRATQVNIANSTPVTGAFSEERQGCRAAVGGHSMGLILTTNRVQCGNHVSAAGGVLCEYHQLESARNVPFTAQCRAQPGVRFNAETLNGQLPVGQNAVCPRAAFVDSAFGFCDVHAMNFGNGSIFTETRSAPGRPLAEQLSMTARCTAIMDRRVGSAGSVVQSISINRNTPVPDQCPHPRQGERRMCARHLEDWEAAADGTTTFYATIAPPVAPPVVAAPATPAPEATPAGALDEES